jgi:hypothetical protein
MSQLFEENELEVQTTIDINDSSMSNDNVDENDNNFSSEPSSDLQKEDDSKLEQSSSPLITENTKETINESEQKEEVKKKRAGYGKRKIEVNKFIDDKIARDKSYNRKLPTIHKNLTILNKTTNASYFIITCNNEGYIKYESGGLFENISNEIINDKNNQILLDIFKSKINNVPETTKQRKKKQKVSQDGKNDANINENTITNNQTAKPKRSNNGVHVETNINKSYNINQITDQILPLVSELQPSQDSHTKPMIYKSNSNNVEDNSLNENDLQNIKQYLIKHHIKTQQNKRKTKEKSISRKSKTIASETVDLAPSGDDEYDDDNDTPCGPMDRFLQSTTYN